jgi:serine protease
MRTVFGFVFCLMLSMPFIKANGIGISELPNGQRYVANQIWVINEYDAPAYLTGQDRGGVAVTGVASVDQLCRNFGVTKVERFYRGRLTKPALIREVSRMYTFTLTDGLDAASLLADFSADPHIELAELCYLPKPSYTPNDPRYGDQWYLPFTHADQAWDIVRGDTTRHAIIAVDDSEVRWDHPDLATNIWVNPGEDINHNGVFDQGDLNGVDDDENGFVDDVVGYDFGDNDYNTIDDNNAHGTPVAGAASAATDNGLLIAGMGYSARIMCLKGWSSQGADHLYDGFVYAAEMGAQIINCSWGTLVYSQAEQNIVTAAWESGLLIIASAGGQGNSTPNYPAAYVHAMAVAATSENDILLSFSGYGSWVDICAPGINILTTYPPSGLSTYNGTSFSTALVSGLAALICSWRPSYTNDQIEAFIEQSADSIDHLNPSRRGQLGAGRINCYQAISSITGIDDDPTAPDKIALYPNYPNPFNAQTVISYYLPEQSDVTLDIYDLLGRKTSSLVSEKQEAGEHSVVWDGVNLPSGIYLCKFKAGAFSESRRMTLLK